MRPLFAAASGLSRTPLARAHAVAPRLGAAAAAPRLAAAAPQRLALPSAFPRRPFGSSSSHRSRYERFDGPFSGQPSGRPDPMAFLRRRLGGDRAIIIYGIAIGGGTIYYIVHLERVPETGRLRFMDVSRQQEAELGQASFGETMQEFRGKILPPTSLITRRVRAVADRIVEANGLGYIKSGHTLGAVELPWGLGGGGGSDDDKYQGADKPSSNTEWEVYVVDEPKVKNAFVLPGGKIFVFTGILGVSANDSGLATVLGHEIAHVVARHGAERMSYMKVLFGISFLLESLGFDVGLTRLLVTFMLQLPNSRTSETEADTIGLQLMARACFDPAEAPKMWERMSQEDGGGGGMDFMSTHPANAKRIKALTKQLPEAEHLRDEKCDTSHSQASGFQDAFNRSTGAQGGQGGNWGAVWA